MGHRDIFDSNGMFASRSTFASERVYIKPAMRPGAGAQGVKRSRSSLQVFPVGFTLSESVKEQSLSWRASVERTACGSEKRSVEYWFKGLPVSSTWPMY